MKYFFFLAAMAIMVGCKKSGGDTTKPVVVITTPTANQEFPAFSSITISGTVADENGINVVQIIVTNMSNSMDLLHIQHTIGANSYNINEVFTAQPSTTYKIHVEADDLAGNNTVVEMQVKGN